MQEFKLWSKTRLFQVTRAVQLMSLKTLWGQTDAMSLMSAKEIEYAAHLGGAQDKMTA